jgi:hypothetical protein
MKVQRGPAPVWEQCNATATHAPVTAAMIQRTTGPVLEVGVGHFSTPFFHFMCQGDRELVSVDTDDAWIDFIQQRFNSPNHRYYCTDLELISEKFFGDPGYKDKRWGLAFVDCSPETDRRVCIELLRTRADYIVVHDSEPLATVYLWGDLFNSFKYQFYYDTYHNGTTVISDVKEIPIR